MSVGVMKDYKLKLRKLRSSHTLGSVDGAHGAQDLLDQIMSTGLTTHYETDSQTRDCLSIIIH